MKTEAEQIKSDALYAAYANHCAIRGVVPLDAKMWERAGRPKVPGGGQ